MPTNFLFYYHNGNLNSILRSHHLTPIAFNKLAQLSKKIIIFRLRVQKQWLKWALTSYLWFEKKAERKSRHHIHAPFFIEHKNTQVRATMYLSTDLSVEFSSLLNLLSVVTGKDKVRGIAQNCVQPSKHSKRMPVSFYWASVRKYTAQFFSQTHTYAQTFFTFPNNKMSISSRTHILHTQLHASQSKSFLQQKSDFIAKSLPVSEHQSSFQIFIPYNTVQCCTLDTYWNWRTAKP